MPGNDSMAGMESFRIYPNNVLNSPTIKEQDYMAHSGRFNNNPVPYVCTNTGHRCCQEGRCKSPKASLQASLDFMRPNQIIELTNFCRHKRWISPCHKMVSKYNASWPQTQKNFNPESIEVYPPFTPMMTVSHLDYRDFVDDEVLLKQYKRVVDKAQAEDIHRSKNLMLLNKGFHTPWSDSRYGTNCLFQNYPNRLQDPVSVKTSMPDMTPSKQHDYRARRSLDIYRQRIRRFPPNFIRNYPPC